MTSHLETWFQGPMYEVVWLFEDNRHDPNPIFMGSLRLAEQAILERHLRTFSTQGRLNDSKKGHWRKGSTPYNKIFEFKACSARLLAFTARGVEGKARLVLAALAFKDGSDIKREDEQRAVDRRQRYLAQFEEAQTDSPAHARLRRSS